MNLKSERFEMRLEQQLADRIDNWRSRQSDVPSRSEAVRRLVEAGLTREAVLNPGQSLITYLLCDIYKTLTPDGEIDPSFIQKVILEGQYWALNWELPGIFHNYVASDRTVTEVVNILDMFSFIEESDENISPQDKEYLKNHVEFLDINKHFHGFDGNNESKHLGIANFLINEMNRFGRFKGRDLNSHAPTIDKYRSMLSVFLPARATLMGTLLDKKQLAEILNAPFV